MVPFSDVIQPIYYISILFCFLDFYVWLAMDVKVLIGDCECATEHWCLSLYLLIGNCCLPGCRPRQDPDQALCWWRNLCSTTRERERMWCVLGPTNMLSCQRKPHGTLHHDWCMPAGFSTVYYCCHSILWVCQSRQKGNSELIRWFLVLVCIKSRFRIYLKYRKLRLFWS